MADKPVYLVSDLHLGAVPPETERAFRRWLAHVAPEASRIVINGDLFDFWFEYRSVIPKDHVRVLADLADIVDAGVPVTYLGGNHDWWGGSFLRDDLGIDFRQEPVVLDLWGRKALIAHGDGLGLGDLGYRALRLILRGRFTRWAFRWIHPDAGKWLANRVSQTEKRSELENPPKHERAGELEDWARARLSEDPDLFLVALGHTHIPVLEEVELGRFYLNSGDWVYNRTYAVLEPDRPPRLEEWEG